MVSSKALNCSEKWATSHDKQFSSPSPARASHRSTSHYPAHHRRSRPSPVPPAGVVAPPNPAPPESLSCKTQILLKLSRDLYICIRNVVGNSPFKSTNFRNTPILSRHSHPSRPLLRGNFMHEQTTKTSSPTSDWARTVS